MQHILPRQHRFQETERDETGQAMVEFAFTFILFIAVLMAVILFAYVFFVQASLVHSAQQGSRHLLAHPVLPSDQVTFATADAEATWVVTSSVPLLDWHEMQITIEPPVEDRVLGTYVAVRVRYNVPLPDIEVPFFLTGQTFVLLPPMQLQALSRRALNWQ